MGSVGGAFLGGLVGVTPVSGTEMLLKVFAILVVGGMGSIGGAAVAAIVLGLSESFVAFYASAYTTLLFFGLLFAMLLIRPNGLFGVRELGDVDLR